MRGHALPLANQILLLLLAPPILSGVFWVMSRGWAQNVQGESISKKTKSRQMSEFWVLLIVLYVGMGCMFIWGLTIRSR